MMKGKMIERRETADRRIVMSSEQLTLLSLNSRRISQCQLLCFVFVCFSGACIGVQAQTPDETPAQSLVSTDQVVIRKDGSPRTRVMSGVIEDIAGQTIVLRRSGNAIDVFTLREVVAVRFQKSPEFDDGIAKLRDQDWKGALSALQAAAAIEPRKWAVREIRAAIAQALRALGRFEECLQTIEQIMSEDPASRHVWELPLVWDERLPEQQRISLRSADLQSKSPVRQLTAASALLHEPQHQAAAMAALQSLRKTSRGPLQELAETQLWRISLLRPTELRESEVTQWTERVRDFDRRTRSGPEFLIGRALLRIHDYDNAATHLLWMPLVEPLDPATTSASLADAITALELSGRTEEAARLRREHAAASIMD